ncbi:osteoglycin, paralog a isoform X1 [Coregonus clupeaformis]|uniref:osteoglycin, paralog a isoform X1 n=1 Tax=Coregonus clupeaformis TaxID=59861 RepID=UPI001BE06FA6|nr:osteoglycin, paralog a isoform X1 [Coregonus clupeaformis]
MGTLRVVLLLSLIPSPWVLCSTGKHFNQDSTLTLEQQDVLFNRETYLEARRSKREAAALWLGEDYDSSMVFLPADEPDDAPAEGVNALELPTCLLCVCLTGSVYCEEVVPEMSAVPTLPKETAYLYARYNKINKITNKDFAEIVTLKRIDLTGNLISEIEDGAFSKLTLLEELNLAENQLVKLPMLPSKLTTFNANHNQLKTKGVKAKAFKKLEKLINLFLGDNALEAVPVIPESVRIVHLQNNNITDISSDTFCKGNNTYYIRPNLKEVRLDGNPVLLSKHPDSFTCLKSLPVGQYR